MNIRIERLQHEHQAAIWEAAFRERNFRRPDNYYRNCLEENIRGTRVTLLAYADDAFAGCAHLLYASDYPFFRQRQIPEINDLNVFAEFRRRGIANRLLDEFERIAARTNRQVGIGVGLFRSYGAAQRIYCRRGYIPDGNGIIYRNEEVRPGERVKVDHDLALYFTKDVSG